MKRLLFLLFSVCMFAAVMATPKDFRISDMDVGIKFENQEVILESSVLYSPRVFCQRTDMRYFQDFDLRAEVEELILPNIKKIIVINTKPSDFKNKYLSINKDVGWEKSPVYFI